MPKPSGGYRRRVDATSIWTPVKRGADDPVRRLGVGESPTSLAFAEVQARTLVAILRRCPPCSAHDLARYAVEVAGMRLQSVMQGIDYAVQHGLLAEGPDGELYAAAKGSS